MGMHADSIEERLKSFSRCLGNSIKLLTRLETTGLQGTGALFNTLIKIKTLSQILGWQERMLKKLKQVTIHLEISVTKFWRLIREGVVIINREEMRCGHADHHDHEEVKAFLRALNEFQRAFNNSALDAIRPKEPHSTRCQGNEDPISNAGNPNIQEFEGNND